MAGQNPGFALFQANETGVLVDLTPGGSDAATMAEVISTWPMLEGVFPGTYFGVITDTNDFIEPAPPHPTDGYLQ